MSWFVSGDCSLDDFITSRSERLCLDQLTHAVELQRDIPTYEAEAFNEPAISRSLFAELASILLDGPGVFHVAGALSTDVVDEATLAFAELIRIEQDEGRSAGDHFAEPGTNQRLWNAQEKLACHRPDVFVRYFANEVIAGSSRAWLGPSYQVTSQVNVVNPGGKAQKPHRDFHLGFMTDEQAAAFPAHIHRLSPLLTLQGAIAHCDMPLESGPTMLLPYSQRYEAGYLAWRQPDFIEYFDEHHVQLPLAKGDMVFFNPALFHGAGTNVTGDISRMANLLQVSSAMGRAMEQLDRRAMCIAVYPSMLEMVKDGVPPARLQSAIEACAEGYAFPADLDSKPPIAGLAPPSQADIMAEALSELASPEDFEKRLD